MWKCFPIRNMHRFFLNLALNVSKSVKYWFKCIYLAKINWVLHEQCARGCKRAQEGDDQKRTNLKILMHLLQNISFHKIWFAHGFPTSTYTLKGRRPYLFSVLKFDATSFAQIWANLKIQDFVITHLQRYEGEFRSWKQKWSPTQYAATRCMPTELLLVNGCWNTGEYWQLFDSFVKFN